MKLGKQNANACDLAQLDCFVLDMDGTINLDYELIDGALEFIEIMQRLGTKFYFFTNNTSKAPDDYVEKLTKLGFSGMTREHIMTAGDVMVHYLKTHAQNPKIYLAGTPMLERQFADAGIALAPPDVDAREIDFVVQAFDTTYNYEKMTAVCRLVAQNVPFLATNIDRVCPMGGGLSIPDCGSMCTMVTHATGKEPKYVGKPFKETVDFILAKTGTKPEKTAMVGDRLYTDIKTAVVGGICGIAVLSGEVTYDEIIASDIHPDYILQSVKDIYHALYERSVNK